MNHNDQAQSGEIRETIQDLSPEQLLQAVQQLLISTRYHQSRSDRAYANELAARIITAMPEEHCVKAAETVAKMSEAPEELLRQLAFSSEEAAQIILTARHTTDAILMEAVSKSFELRKIVASRRQLSEPVVNRLLFFEETAIENVILPRSELPLSDSRARRLIGRVEKGSTLGWMLAKRSDISPRLSLRLFWKVEGESRSLILGRFNVDPSFAAKIFTQVLSGDSRRYGNAPLANLARLVARARSTDDQGERRPVKPSHENALHEMRSNATLSAAQHISDQTLISLDLARKIMEDPDGEAFAVLCSALNVNEKTFRKLIGERPPKGRGLQNFSSDHKERLVRIFESLNPSSAVAILSYWDIDIQDQLREKAQERLEMDIADIRSRLADAYGADDVPDEETAKTSEAPEPDDKPEKKKRRRLFG